MLKSHLNLYEINTRVWLKELSSKYKKSINLSNIPEGELKRLKTYGFDMLWLMGIWEPSQTSRKIALSNKFLLNECRISLPDLAPHDIISSPYAIKDYKVSFLLGSEKDIVNFKNTLNKLGIKLIIDFVPNHLALDSPWVKEYPDFFIQGDPEDFRKDPETFFVEPQTDAIFAHGKDPYFPAWCDTVQLNYYNNALRSAMIKILLKIASISDGIRCDMAMLILNRFQKFVWKDKIFNEGKFKEPKKEFWEEAIPKVKKIFPDFVFIAESYWDTEKELFSFGFDYAYDKALYDALQYQDIRSIKMHFERPKEEQIKLVRFIENHDEPRALFAFGRDKSKAAASLIFFMPGVSLFHEGQFEGNKIKLPLQLSRRRYEAADVDISNFYETLFRILREALIEIKDYNILAPKEAWEGNNSHGNFLVFLLKANHGEYLFVVNYFHAKSQCYVPLYFKEAKPEDDIVFKELFEGEEFIRPYSQIASKGFYLDEEPFKIRLFKLGLSSPEKRSQANPVTYYDIEK